MSTKSAFQAQAVIVAIHLSNGAAKGAARRGRLEFSRIRSELPWPTAKTPYGGIAVTSSRTVRDSSILVGKWDRELDYRLVKDLWAFTDDRIAVRFQYEWHDAAGQWHRSYGNELWEFDEAGLMRRREASINDVDIRESERKFFGLLPRPTVRPSRHSRGPVNVGSWTQLRNRIFNWKANIMSKKVANRVKLNGLRIFLAGASGVIGQRLIPRLVQAGYMVGGMTRRPANGSC